MFAEFKLYPELDTLPTLRETFLSHANDSEKAINLWKMEPLVQQFYKGKISIKRPQGLIEIIIPMDEILFDFRKLAQNPLIQCLLMVHNSAIKPLLCDGEYEGIVDLTEISKEVREITRLKNRSSTFFGNNMKSMKQKTKKQKFDKPYDKTFDSLLKDQLDVKYEAYISKWPLFLKEIAKHCYTSEKKFNRIQALELVHHLSLLDHYQLSDNDILELCTKYTIKVLDIISWIKRSFSSFNTRELISFLFNFKSHIQIASFKYYFEQMYLILGSNLLMDCFDCPDLLKSIEKKHHDFKLLRDLKLDNQQINTIFSHIMLHRYSNLELASKYVETLQQFSPDIVVKFIISYSENEFLAKIDSHQILAFATSSNEQDDDEFVRSVLNI